MYDSHISGTAAPYAVSKKEGSFDHRPCEEFQDLAFNRYDFGWGKVETRLFSKKVSTKDDKNTYNANNKQFDFCLTHLPSGF